jgi:phage terminase large subunit-like protein
VVVFDNDKALRAVNFIELLKHTKGAFRGKPFELLPWQHEIVSDVYGTMNDKGLRQYQYVYLEVPKKNGKSELVAATALYHTFADGEMKGEIYGCAADRAQASLAFDVAVDMVDQNAYLKKRCKYTASKKQLMDKASGSIYQVLSAEAYTKHGLNASAVIFDELHAQPNRDLWEVMTFGAGDARLQPIWWVITTAGDDPDRKSIGWEIHEKAHKIINGELIEPRWYCKIWGIPHDYPGDIWDEELWYKVNPSLGYTIDIDKVRLAADAARDSAAEEKLFRWLRLNQWVSLKRTGWLPLTLWDETTGSWNSADMIGKRCYIGLDLSSTTDLTAVALLFPPQSGIDEWRCMFEAWIPEENMKERIHRDHVPYDKWVKDKYLHATQGDVVDYEFVQARIEALARQYDVKYICADKWNSQMLTQILAKKGIKTIEIPQTIAGMSPGMKELERLLRSGQMTHDVNPLARWAFGNVVIFMDGNENIKPMKNRSIDRIDPIVALISAVNAAIKLEKKKGAYEDHGMRVV